MKTSISNLLSFAGLKNNSKQRYMCAYYLINGKVNFLHVVEMPYPKNIYIAPFGVPDGIETSQTELNEVLSKWLETNKAEAYNERTPNERMADIYTFDYSQLNK